MTFVERLQEAVEFARHHHRDQKYGDEPYIHHLYDVFFILLEFGITDEDILIAAILHDIVEDTGVEMLDLDAKFGTSVSDLVWRVTGVGPNRKTRNAVSLAKIKKCDKARLLKLADRIANVRAGGDKVEMYRKEHASFRDAIQPPIVDSIEVSMWGELVVLLGSESMYS